MFEPDYRNIVKAALNQETARIPLYEHNVSMNKIGEIKDVDMQALYRGDEKDIHEFFRVYCNFFKEQGYDVVTFEQCIGLIMPGAGALILPYAAFSMASAILMICAFFRSIPVEMEEAAAIDGCNVYRTFVSIMVPMVKPALATQGMLMFIQNWNEYALANILAMGEKMRIIPLALNLFFGQFDLTNWGEVGAAVAVTSLPVIVVFVFCNKQIEQAMTGSSGLK